MPGKKIETIFGYHAVRHVLSKRPHDVLEIFIADNKLRSVRMDVLLRAVDAASISIQYISPRKLNRLTGINNHQGIAARCRAVSADKQMTIDDLCAGNLDESSVILVLDRVTDPHNLGACIRTADAAGVNAVVLPRDHSAPLNATVNKVASGALESMDVITVTNLARCLRQLRAAGCEVIGAADDADTSIYKIEVTFPLALVMGSEEEGMRQNTRNHCDQLVKIPMYGSVESLNLSVAAGVCLYGLRRHTADLLIT